MPELRNSPGVLKAQPIPAHIGQALAVTAAQDDLGITPMTAQNMWVVSTLVHDPLMRPAFWANLVVEGERPDNFWAAVAAAKDESPVYLSGAANNRTFHGDVVLARVFKSLGQACPQCQLVQYSHALYAVDGQNWFQADGTRLPPGEAEAIRRGFSLLAQSVEKGDIPQEMAKRWKRLLEESPQAAGPQSAEASPIMHIGSQFYKRG